MAPDLLTLSTLEGKEGVNSMILSTLDTTRDDLLRSLQARTLALESGAPENPRRVLVTRRLAYLSDARAAELQARMDELLADFEAANLKGPGKDGESPPGETASPYALAVAFYPSFYFEEPEKQS